MTVIEGDVLVRQTNDGGEITIEGGLVEMTGGFETAFYFALFGGNQDDDGTQNSKNNWWGNLTEEDPDLHYRSQFQYLLTRLVPISGNLVRLENAAKKDLVVFIRQGAVDSIEVNISIVAVRKIEVKINFVADGENIEIKFIENWIAMEKELT